MAVQTSLTMGCRELLNQLLNTDDGRIIAAAAAAAAKLLLLLLLLLKRLQGGDQEPLNCATPGKAIEQCGCGHVPLGLLVGGLQPFPHGDGVAQPQDVTFGAGIDVEEDQ